MEGSFLECGINNKDSSFWRGLRDWDVMVLLETWSDEKSWSKVREWLPEGYVWGVQWATRRNEKGRAMGGMVMGIRKELVEKGMEIEAKGEGIMVGSRNEEMENSLSIRREERDGGDAARVGGMDEGR